jgi:hypothetical protein
VALAQNTLVARIRAELDDEPWEDRLTAAYTAGSGTVTVAQPTQLAEGDILEFPDGTQLRVTATPSGNPVSVKGGHNDTTDTSQANGTWFLKNPTWSRVEITEAIARAIENLWPWVYLVKTTNITPQDGKRYYALPADFRALIAVTQDVTVVAGKPRVLRYGVRGSGEPISIERQLPSTISSTGKALFVPTARTSYGTDLIVTYAALVTPTVAAGNYTDIDDGLMAACLVDGACWRLLEASDTQRTQDDVEQGDIGVAPGARLRDAAWYKEQYEDKRYRLALQLQEDAPLANTWRG